MTRSAAERAASSRQNGQKSQAPQSPAGKPRSRFNALKHGLKARIPVLPGEDAQEYQGRLDAWIADLLPTNDVEQSLVERAVTLTWQLDRAERAETARLAGLIRAAPAEAARRRVEEAAALGQRLCFDRRGPLPLYPHSLYTLPDQPRVSFSRLSDDPDDPPRLLLRLEATASGCRWLLDRCADLRGLLDRGLSWQSPDKLRAIRLLGRQPLEAADSEVVATIFQACHVLDPQTHHQAGVAPGGAATWAAALQDLRNRTGGQPPRAALGHPGAAGPHHPGSPAAAVPGPDSDPDADPVRLGDGDMDDDDALEARIAWQACGAAFTELLGELTEEEARVYRHRLEGRRVDRLRPQDPAAARATLRAIVEKATIRLEAKLEVHEAQAALAAAEAVDRLSFDDSPEGERLRRFQLAGQRALLRTVDSLLKLRLTEPPQPSASDPAEPPGTGPARDGPSATIGCGPEDVPSSFAADPLPAVAELPARPTPAPEPQPAAENLPNEPTAAGADPPILPGDSPATIDDHRISPNEPTAGGPARPAGIGGRPGDHALRSRSHASPAGTAGPTSGPL
jgi:hypothetical protein